MVATDTVVGIVGAVLLAGIMVGVFVYEYNNAPAVGGGNGDDGRSAQVAFEEAYPLLNATEDIDADGTPNYRDDDMDDDGEKDATQPGPLRVRLSWTNTSAAPPAQAGTFSFEFPVARGAQWVEGWLNWTSTTPGPLLSTPDFGCKFGPTGGEAIASCPSVTPQTGSQARSLTFRVEEGLDRGNHTFTVEQVRAGPQVSFKAEFVLEYGPARPIEDDGGPIEK